MGALEKEIQALKTQQCRIEKKQKEQNADVWSRIEILEKIALEKTGVDAGENLPPSVLIAANKIMQKRGLKYLPKK